MLILLSPAKIQNFKTQDVVKSFTIPEYLNEAEQLVGLLRELSPYELGKLLDINASPKVLLTNTLEPVTVNQRKRQ